MARGSILVIDDEIEFIDAVKMRLEANDFTVIGAQNGKDGFEKAHTESPRLILLDLVMPKMNGFEALSKLKSDPRTSLIPVIVVTAQGDIEYAFDAGKLGASDYLIKPVSMEGLLGLVNKYIA